VIYSTWWRLPSFSSGKILTSWSVYIANHLSILGSVILIPRMLSKNPREPVSYEPQGHVLFWMLSTIDKSCIVILLESNYIVVSLKLHNVPWSCMKGDLQKKQIPKQVIMCWCHSKLQILLIQEIFWTILGPLHRDGNQITDMMFTLMLFTMITNREYWAWKKEKTNEKRQMPKLT